MGAIDKFYGPQLEKKPASAIDQFYGDALIAPRPPAGVEPLGVGDQAPLIPGGPLLTLQHFEMFRNLSEPEAFAQLADIEQNNFYGMSMQEYQKLIGIYFDEISPNTPVDHKFASSTGRFRDMGGLQQVLSVVGVLPISDLVQGKPIGTSAGLLIEQLDYLDRPRRMITNAAYWTHTDPRSKQFSPGQIPQLIHNIMTGTKPDPLFDSLEDAIKKGWSGQESLSTRKTLQTIAIGPTASAGVDDFMDSHTATRWAKKIGDISGDLLTDIIIDWGVVNGIMKPIRWGTEATAIRAGTAIGTAKTKQFFAKLGRTPGSPLGFKENVMEGINRVGRERGVRFTQTADDLMRESLRISSGTEITPIYKTTVTEQAAKRGNINVAAFDVTEAKKAYRETIGKRSLATQEVNNQLDRIRNFIDTEIPPSGAQGINPSSVLDSTDEWLLRQKPGLGKARRKESLLIRQSRRNLGEVAEAEELHRTLTKNYVEGDQLGAIDYLATSRVLREEYVTSTLKRTGQELKKPIEFYVNAVTPADVSGDIALLSDEAFDAVFDLIEWSNKNPKFFDMIKADMSSVPSLAKRPRVNQFYSNTKQAFTRLFINHTFAPSWQVFHRHNADDIYQVVDAARVSQFKHVEEKMYYWNYLMQKSGARKSKVVSERIFNLAWGKTDDYNVLARGISDAQRAVERQTANYFRDTAKEFADMAVVQGRLSLTGEGVPKVIENYVPFMYEQAAIDAIRLENQYKVLAKQLADEAGEAGITEARKASLLQEAEIALRNSSEARYTLDDLADLFEFQTKTRVDIPEFQKRFTQGEGIIKDVDMGFTRMLSHESKALYMQPGFQQANTMARLTENSELIAYTRQWINAQQGLPSKLEARLEPLARNITQIVDAVTPAQWVAKDRAVRQISQWFRGKAYFAGMGFNPGPVVTNATQSLLTNAAIGTEATFMGFRSLATEGGQAMLKHSRVLLGRNPMSTMSLDSLSKINKAGGWSFRMVDRWMNVSPAYNGAMYKLIRKNPDNMAKLSKYGSTQGNGFWKSMSRAMDAGEFAPEMLMADRIVKLTQYSYLPHDLPKYMWGPIGKAFGQFSTWPANYFTSFLPEMTKWMWTGQAPWGKMTAIERATLFRHVATAEVLVLAGKQAGLDFTKHRPVQGTAPYLGGPTPQGSPAINIVQGLIKWTTAKGDARRSGEGLYLIRSGAMIGKVGPVPIPFFPTALRRVGKTIETGDPREMFFRVNPEESFKSQLGGLGGLGSLGGL